MAKDVKKTQKKNIKNDEIKKQPVKVVKKEKKVVEAELVNEDKLTMKKEQKNKKVIEQETKKEKLDSKKGATEKIVTTAKVVDNNRKAILFGIVGFLVATLLFRCILWPDRIATLSDGTQPVANINGEAYTADKLYEEMKEQYSVNILLNSIDEMLLNEIYPEDDELKKSVQDTADYYYSYYETYYKQTKEQFLSSNGFSNEDAFLDVLKLDYRRNKYYEDYAEKLVSEEEINKYYKDSVYGDVDSKHILVKIAKEGEEGLNDADAKKLAKEIVEKLNKGKTWEEVTEEYKDKIITEELGYQAFNASLEKTYLEECKNLEVGKYSKSPVKTSYGYHIVYKKDQKEKPALEEVKIDIVDILASEKKSADQNLYHKALINLREESKLEFVDTKLGDEYKEYLNTYK